MEERENDLPVLVREVLARLVHLSSVLPTRDGTYREVQTRMVFERQFKAFEDEFYAALPFLRGLWNKSIEGTEDARAWDHEWSPSCVHVSYWVREFELYAANKPKLERLLEQLERVATELGSEDAQDVLASTRCFWDDLTQRQKDILKAMATEPEKRWSAAEIAKLIGVGMDESHVFRAAGDLQKRGVVKKTKTGYRIDLAPQSAPYEVLAASARRI